MTDKITTVTLPAYSETEDAVSVTAQPATVEVRPDGSEVAVCETEFVQVSGAKKLVRTTTTTTITRRALSATETAIEPQLRRARKTRRYTPAETAPASFLETADEMPLLALPEEEGTVRVMGSFLAKLSMCADTPVMEYYSVVKSVLQGDHRVKVRHNWQFESFVYGRDQVAKLAVQGGKLVLCLALRPGEYDPAVYAFRDVGAKKKYEYVPLLLELISDKALADAVTLICEVLWKMGLTPGTPDSTSYQIPGEDWEKLYREGQLEFQREWEDGTSQILHNDPTVLSAFFAQSQSLPLLQFVPVETTADGIRAIELPEAQVYRVRAGNASGVRAENGETETKTVREVTEEIIDLPSVVEVPRAVAAAPEVQYIEVPVAEEDAEAEIETPTVRYRYSYLARLVGASGITKEYYSTIKNEALSYYDVESTVGMESENFTYGGKQLLVLALRGNTVLVYFALDPAEYRDHPQYILDDVSHIRKYTAVPVLLRVDSERTLRCAVDLIAELMEQVKARRGVRPATDYRIAYEKREDLLARGIVGTAESPIDATRLREAIAELMPEPQPFAPEPEKPTPAEKPQKVRKPKKEAPPKKEEDEDPDSEILTDAEGHAYRIHYRRSFTARLSHAKEPIRNQYNAIKGRLLSFDGVCAEVTWDGERFTRGGKTVAYMLIKSKALYLYLALEPADFKYSPYHFNDVSEQKARKDTPMEIRLRSDWLFRQTMKLLEEEFAQIYEVSAGAVESVDYCPPYQTTEELVAGGLIKTRTVALED